MLNQPLTKWHEAFEKMDKGEVVNQKRFRKGVTLSATTGLTTSLVVP